MFIEGKKKLSGKVKMPGDKSISHRSVIFGSIAIGPTIIENILDSEDISSTINLFRLLGVNIYKEDNRLVIKGQGLFSLKSPTSSLDCGNSGTTLRLLGGLLSGQTFKSQLIGDNSLNQRPMKRIIDPLVKMGAKIENLNYKPPITIHPVNKLKNIEYFLPVASAQVKSSILLASLYSEGRTTIHELSPTRNHTEKMMEFFGADIEYDDRKTIINNPNEFNGKTIYVPGDISSAAYFIVGALITEGSEIVIENVGLNPTRSGILDILKGMGGNIKVLNTMTKNNETFGDIVVKSSKLHSIEINESLTPNIIDEIPILAVAASFSEGKTIIKGLEELRLKETDRLSAIYTELNKMGAQLKVIDNNLIIHGKDKLKPANLESYGDHRIAMALSIAALNTKGKSYINESNCVKISYPDFHDEVFRLIH